MNRSMQVLLMGSAAGFCWLGMMAVHELGHVLSLWLTGGTVERVVLHPLEISRTDPGENPRPLFVAWGGALWGCGIPLAALLLTRAVAPRHAYLAALFAGFCLIANGAYLAADALVRGGDARTLIQHGAPPWLPLAVGVPAVVLGLYLWNGLGPAFGLGEAAGRVDRRAAFGTFAALAVLAALELACFGR
jgi:hypothetical protein